MDKNRKHQPDNHLKLRSETVRTLTPEETEKIAGGGINTTTTPICMSLTCVRANNGR